ncbi:MAG: ankyrin repeat domain-containing protein [Pyrinomonadaceae bacterium]|nr:ankyrin repeat domain-containing protein [Pyrinomonadaceae bacterium]
MSSAVSIRQQAVVEESHALARAAEGGDLDAVKMLLAAGANVNAAGAYGKTPLIAAAAQGHAGIVRLLLERGAEINARKSDGFTALISAVFFGHEEVVRTLLAHNADVSLADRTGSTAYNWSLSRGLPQLAKLLKGGGTASTVPATPVRSAPPRRVEPVALPQEIAPSESPVKAETDFVASPPVADKSAAAAVVVAAETPAAAATAVPVALESAEPVSIMPPPSPGGEPVNVRPPLPPSPPSPPVTVVPPTSELISESPLRVKSIARRAPRFARLFQPAVGRVRDSVTWRQLCAAFIIGGLAGGVLALAVGVYEPPTAAAPNPVVATATTGAGTQPEQSPSSSTKAADQDVRKTKPIQTQNLKSVAPASREAVAASDSAPKSTARAKDKTDSVSSAPPSKAAHATIERQREERRASSSPATVKAAAPEKPKSQPKPASKTSAERPASAASAAAKQPATESFKARPTAPPSSPPPTTKRTERSSAPPSNAPQPTASPAKKVIRWP